MNKEETQRILKRWAMEGHKDCRHCGRKIHLHDFYEPGGKVKRTPGGEPTMLFCGTKGCSTMWWNCPFCGKRLT